MSAKIELPCRIGFAIGALMAGLMLVGMAVPLAVGGKPVAEWVFIGGCGAPLLLHGLRGVLLRPPHLRATAAGLWFGGGRIVPWSAVKAIYPSAMDVQISHVRTKTKAVSIDFHRRRTLLRLPVRAWFATIACVGDIDVGCGNASVLASQLDAMRALACGIEDGVVVGAAPLPAARLVK
jgi:hypothetical protein